MRATVGDENRRESHRVKQMDKERGGAKKTDLSVKAKVLFVTDKVIVTAVIQLTYGYFPTTIFQIRLHFGPKPKCLLIGCLSGMGKYIDKYLTNNHLSGKLNFPQPFSVLWSQKLPLLKVNPDSFSMYSGFTCTHVSRFCMLT